MVKLFILIFFLLTEVAFSKVYEIKIVKHKDPKEVNNHSFIVYKVKPGDTLSGIMRKFKLPPTMMDAIVDVNRIKNPNLIYAGQKLKLPVGMRDSSQGIPKKIESFLPAIRMLGGKIDKSGAIFLKSGRVDFRKNPKISINGEEFILDFTDSLNGELEKKLGAIGIRVIKPGELKNLLEDIINLNFGVVEKNGELVLGMKDVLIYKYDYLSYNVSTGNRIVINLKRDTPVALVNLLKTYGVEVLQPEGKELEGKEGELRILSGGGIEKIAELVRIVVGEKGVLKDSGVEFPENHLFVAFDFVDPEEKVKLELEGYKVVVLSGDFIRDVEKIFSLIPVVHKRVNFVVVEPPGSDGERSKFEIPGLLISTEKKDWFLIDCVDKPEEIPYLRSRGVNLIIY